MEIICTLFPAIISTYIFFVYVRKNKDAKSIDLLAIYSISAILNNFVQLFLLCFIKNTVQIDFSYTVFNIKYLLSSVSLAIALPFTYKIIFPFLKKIKIYLNKENLKSYYKNNKRFVWYICFILLNIVIFYSIDLYLRHIAITLSSFNSLSALGTNLFTILYISLFIAFMCFLPRVLSIIFSIILYITTIVFFLIHYFLLNIKGDAFSIYELNNTSEGMKYYNFMLNEINFKFIIFLIFIVISCVLCVLLLRKIKKRKTRIIWTIKIIFVLFVFSLFIKIIPKTLEYSDDDWQNISYPKYFYLNMVNPKKSLTTMGLYEYTVKDISEYFNNKNNTYGSIKDINKLFKKYYRIHEPNEYTGMFKDKNLIMIMMESIDYASISKESTPTLYKLMNNGWTFPNRYSALSSGGSTILTEYTSLTGLLYDTKNYSKVMSNNYDYSLPNMFNNNGYITSFFHENNGRYYNREKLHSSTGFSNKYFLFDNLKERAWDCPQQFETNVAYDYCDSQFVNNEDLYSKLVNKDNKFMSMIVTIAAHGPYDSSNPLCSDLNDNQTKCIKRLAGKTDDLITNLIDKLEEDGLMDDTVIVLYTDHQAYGLDYQKSYLDKLPMIDENKNIKSIPLIIYTGDIKKKEFTDTLVNDIDIVPTLLNLFGMQYNPNIYIGNDLFDKNRKNIVMFTDGTWYNGEDYSESKNVNKNSQGYMDEYYYVQDMLDLNKMIISNNYYSSVK